MTDADLLAAARVVAGRAHSPYSRVEVGAALLASDGRVFSACNVENASFGLTQCAERAAVCAAVAAGARSFRAIAIVTNLSDALMPCGACRQVLQEFAPNVRVLVAGKSGAHRTTTLSRLLPHAFGPDALR